MWVKSYLKGKSMRMKIQKPVMAREKSDPGLRRISESVWKELRH